MVRKSLLDPTFINVITLPKTSNGGINYLYILFNYIIPLVVLVIYLFILKMKYNQKMNKNYLLNIYNKNEYIS